MLSSFTSTNFIFIITLWGRHKICATSQTASRRQGIWTQAVLSPENILLTSKRAPAALVPSPRIHCNWWDHITEAVSCKCSLFLPKYLNFKPSCTVPPIKINNHLHMVMSRIPATLQCFLYASSFQLLLLDTRQCSEMQWNITRHFALCSLLFTSKNSNFYLTPMTENYSLKKRWPAKHYQFGSLVILPITPFENDISHDIHLLWSNYFLYRLFLTIHY